MAEGTEKLINLYGVTGEVLPPGQDAGDLLTWNGIDWVAAKPSFLKSQEFSMEGGQTEVTVTDLEVTDHYQIWYDDVKQARKSRAGQVIQLSFPVEDEHIVEVFN